MTLPNPAPDVPGASGTDHSGTGSAHAKVILLGEHAVVYGAPAIAVPVPQLTVTATASRCARAPDDGRDVFFTLTGSASQPVVMRGADGLRHLVRRFEETTALTCRPPVDVLFDCVIPPSRGLGASAACARAAVLALGELFGRAMSPTAVFDLVQAAESMTHGRASGVDALATGSPGPLLFETGGAREPRIGCEALLVIADSGTTGSTKEAVTLLRHRFDQGTVAREEFEHRATGLVAEAVRDLAEGRVNDLGTRLTAYHELLSGAGLSTEHLDTLVSTALAAGGLGAKVSGGGLGGCVIALAAGPAGARQVARRLRAAGAEETWTVPLGRCAGDAR